MNSFSPEWLALREPADLAARNPDVLDACARAFAHREALTICDLGAGSGASLRAFTRMLPAYQQWTLVDHDAANLAAVHFSGDSSRVTYRVTVHDFAKQPGCWPAQTELVTASALLDLTSADWIARFVAALAADRVAVLATLSFDGVIVADPAHPLDAVVATAFGIHQTSDKGFGPAAGPAAAGILTQNLQDTGYEVTAGDSPRKIDRTAPALLRQTLEGIAAAVRETGLIPQVDEWLRDRLANVRVLTIGHRDIFARPRL